MPQRALHGRLGQVAESHIEVVKWSAPIRNYRATARIIELTDGPRSVVEWMGRYDCDEADEQTLSELLEGLYHSFIGWLADASK